VKPQSGIAAAGQHEADPRGQAHQQLLELLHRLAGFQLIQVIDHQNKRLITARQVLEHLVHDHAGVELG
jgi:hypothetical protein